jgi:hypothetical protein
MRSMIAWLVLLGLMMAVSGSRAADADPDDAVAEALKKEGLDIRPSFDLTRWLVQIADGDLGDKGDLKPERLRGLKTLKKDIELAALRCKFSDAGFAQLAEVPALKMVVLSGTEGVKSLEPATKMTALKGLFLEQVPISDDSLAGLSKCKGLQTLTLRSLKVGDTGLANVGRIPDIKELRIWSCDISDAGLDSLKGLTNLESLEIVNCPKITGAGIASLSGLKKLERLALARSAVTDKALESIKNLTALKILQLPSTKVSDKSVETLSGLTNLEALDLRNTEVSEGAIGKLQKALPKTKVEH